MNQITEGNCLEMTNVLSYRGKVTQQGMAAISQEIEELLKESGATRVGNAVSATFDMTQEHGQVVMDIEILVPLDKPIEAPIGYKLKPVFRLTNAVKIRHEGNPALMQQSAQKLMSYIQQKQYTPITVGYSVTVRAPQVQGDVDSFVTDMYVGISDNIL